MRENITKVAERGERLDSLQDKTGASSFSFSVVGGGLGRDANEERCADNLAVSAQGFRRGANRVRKVRPLSLYSWTADSQIGCFYRTCGKS